MRSKIRRCQFCRLYTLKQDCPRCGAKTSGTIPARFSPEDPYGRYRRALVRRHNEGDTNTQNQRVITG